MAPEKKLRIRSIANILIDEIRIAAKRTRQLHDFRRTRTRSACAQFRYSSPHARRAEIPAKAIRRRLIDVECRSCVERYRNALQDADRRYSRRRVTSRQGRLSQRLSADTRQNGAYRTAN
ncbi:hypothetical protein D3C72_1174350 [compost metagenome]